MKVVHYLNQFFSGHGGETAAQLPPGRLSGAVGPGRMLGIEVAASLFCGDDYFNEQVEEAMGMLLKMLEREKPDVLICGPSFGAGRYGLACGTLARAAAERGIPAVCAMEPESPGVNAAGGAVYIVPTGSSVAEMKHVLPRVAKLAERLGRGKSLGSPDEEGYLPRGVRINELSTALAAERAVEAILDKLDGRIHTEVPLGQEKVPPAEPIARLEQATISLVSEGGLIPIGNPDRLPSHSAEKWFAYSIEGLSSLTGDKFQSIHGGFDTGVANKDPNRLVPLDALRHLERKGRVGHIHPFLYSTTGNSTTVANAVRMGREIAADLKKRGILAALLVGTWGTGTRCGATLAREIERTGIPAVIITALPTVAVTMGANRVVHGVAITHPVGRPYLPLEREKIARQRLVERALEMLTVPVDQGTVWEP